MGIALDEQKNENDKTTESSGIKVVYESDLEAYIENSIVDYSNGWFERGFVIRGGSVSSC